MNRKRAGVSELMGTLIMVTITLIAGAAAFGWVNGQAQSSENAYGASAGQGINYLREHFAIVTSTFTGPAPTYSACSGGPPPTCTTANFWVFNNGQLAFTLNTIQIQTPPTCPLGSCSNYLNIVYQSGSKGYTTITPTQTCSSSTSGGFTTPTTYPVPVGTLSSTNSNGLSFYVTIPSCSGQVNFIVGQGYVVTMTGQFGNVVQYQVTANG